jgi:SAM-dependent methyltransferase
VPQGQVGALFNSQYENAERMKQRLRSGRHRNLVGGLWDVMGDLQLAFLKKAGMLPKHRLLDIGCGCLRAGVKIIPYLEPGNYWGIDAEKSLLDAGYQKEIAPAGLRDRLPRSNLYCSRRFLHQRLPAGTIDFGIMNSVMTHLPLNALRLCLENSRTYFKPGARLFITFFELPDGLPFGQVHRNPAGGRTTGFSDPYHYYRRDMQWMAEDTPWEARYLGDWGHPRGQMMVEYRLKKDRPLRRRGNRRRAGDLERVAD